MNDSLKGPSGEKAASNLKPESSGAVEGSDAFEKNLGLEAAASVQASRPVEADTRFRVEAEAPIQMEPLVPGRKPSLAPVQAGEEKADQARWTRWLVWFLRGMAVLSMLKGLYHWSLVLGIGEGPDTTFTTQSLPWQTATVYFAIIDLVAAVGLWLAAVWGAVVWLTAGVSMAAVEVFFPQIYGGSWVIVAIELILLGCYLVLALQSAREHPH